MSAALAPVPEAVSARRAALARALGDGVAALLPAGAPVSRNYPATTYPFRASSHFLYFVGLPFPRAMLLVDGEEDTLFLPKPAPDDALWHGAVPSFSAVAAHVGLRVRALSELSDAIGGRAVATLAAPDAATRALQTALLGREIAPARLEAPDDRLADAVIALRLRHDEAAIASMRRAVEATTAAHLAAMAETAPGMLEARVRAAMDREIVARNMTHAYGPIVTVHGEVLHNDAHGHVLHEGDLLLADVGAESEDGFASDVTRTWPVTGRFSPTQRDLYRVVLDAQKETIDAVKPGARYRDVHLVAAKALARGLVALGVLRGDVEELVADGVHALLFPHGIGHLLGLDVHDMEDLGDRAGYAPGRARASQFGLAYLRLDRDLEPGMAVTIEPGLYRVPAILADAKLRALAKGRLDFDRLEAFSDVRGIRIEDDVLVTAEGNEVLTRAIPKELDDVERHVGRYAGVERGL